MFVFRGEKTTSLFHPHIFCTFTPSLTRNSSSPPEMALLHYLTRGVCTPRFLGQQTRAFSVQGGLNRFFNASSALNSPFSKVSSNILSSTSLRPIQGESARSVRRSCDFQGCLAFPTFSRSFTSTSGQGSSPATNGKGAEEPHNAYPETPLHFYRATPYSEGSINHRFFYINLIFLLFVYDVGSAVVDL
uniref:Transmembrane protein n=1 Tax=Toxoplasma gondii (strain ATCC 50861 / VEG) TaxID=432359 RepID=A0A0F7UND4_TOXGV|nr:TPA: hypothetical protein BN1205_040860 [Toxoplasma gondii VEG]